MKIIAGLSLEGLPAVIPYVTRDDLPEFFLDMKFKTGAEIGVCFGDFSVKLCEAGLHLYAVDPWMAFRGQGRSQNTQPYQDNNYRIAKERLDKYPNCTIIRKTSEEALKDIPDGSLDFVYIDGDHQLIPVITDIIGWNRKVRSGGVIAGHDYFCTQPWANNVICQVKPAVEACVQVLGVRKYYLIDAESKAPSWLWIKA